ncbi:MAG: LacI family DNA-binding transcriptional regulator, partial [Pseudomonadota bacterium]
MPKPTLVDVAKVAGVSAITVSRALRSPEIVSDSLREKVDEAVRVTGYMPNKSAASLASNRTNSVVVVIPSITNNVFTDVMLGITEALKADELTMQIGNAGYDPLEEERLLRSFLNPAPHGVILAGVEQTPETLAMLRNVNVPIVQIMDLHNDPIGKIVGFSNTDAAEAGTKHLVDQGYRKIGFLGAQMDPRSQQRLAG